MPTPETLLAEAALCAESLQYTLFVPSCPRRFMSVHEARNSLIFLPALVYGGPWESMGVAVIIAVTQLYFHHRRSAPVLPVARPTYRSRTLHPSLNLEQFVARQYWLRRWASLHRFGTNLVQKGVSHRGADLYL